MPASPGTGAKRKIVSPRHAVELIKDGDTVACSGFGGIGSAEELLDALEKRFLETGHPKALTVFLPCTVGDGMMRGLNRLAHEGLIKRCIAGHYALTPKIGKLAMENKIEAYNLPQGCLSQMLRDAGAHKPRTLSTVGLGTFVDPRLEGGKINAKTTEDLVELMEIDGREILAYKPPAIDVAIIRGTTGDSKGNITMEDEALTLDVLSMSIAARNNGGLVIAQVARLADTGVLSQRDVIVPGALVDCVSVASDPENHRQTYGTSFDPAFSGKLRVPFSTVEHSPLDARKVIAKRAAFELIPNCVVNLGVGIPEAIASIAAEEQLLDLVTLTAEPGVIGGLPASGLDFGAARNADAIIDQGYQFDFYDGAGLDIAFLGLAQADQEGNVNVSRFGDKLVGCGGFINISQKSKKVVFMGTFTAGGLEVVVEDGRLHIPTEGKARKFVDRVEQVTFSGSVAVVTSRPVLFITERCVFELTPEGLLLTEVAPGVDMDKHIVSQMGFEPIVEGSPKTMDPRIFSESPMSLRGQLLSVPLEDRMFYDTEQNILFVNFEGLNIRSEDEIRAVRQRVEKILNTVSKRVRVVVNYDRFDILPELLDDYMDAMNELRDRYFEDTIRYTTSTFMRMKLGESLKQRGMSPHIYESATEAAAALKRGLSEQRASAPASSEGEDVTE